MARSFRNSEKKIRIEIRRFSTADAVAASKIIEACFRTMNLGPYCEVCIEGQIRDNSPSKLIEYARTTRYYVAIADERVVGIGGYDAERVRTLFVSPGYQRRGIGAAMLQRILLEARKEGVTRLISWSTYYAEAFYRTFGFTRTGEIFLPYEGSTLSFVEMELDL